MITIKKSELMEVGNGIVLLKEVNEDQIREIVYKELMRRSIICDIE